MSHKTQSPYNPQLLFIVPAPTLSPFIYFMLLGNLGTERPKVFPEAADPNQSKCPNIFILMFYDTHSTPTPHSTHRPKPILASLFVRSSCFSRRSISVRFRKGLVRTTVIHTTTRLRITKKGTSQQEQQRCWVDACSLVPSAL